MAKKKKRPTPPPPPVRRKPPRPVVTEPKRGSSARRVQPTAAESRANVRRALVAGVLATAVLAAVVGLVVLNRRGDAELRKALTSGTCEVDTKSDPTGGPNNNHVPSPTYGVNPPSAGNHLGTGSTSSGVYAGTRVPPDGLLVHSLEHGYVIVWHQPSLPQAERDRLGDFQRAHDGDVIVVERASLPVPVAATAWEQRLLCQQVEIDVLERFLDTYVGKGPENPPRG